MRSRPPSSGESRTASTDEGEDFVSRARRQQRRLGLAFAMTATILVAQAAGVFLTGSLALLTDTLHMLVDSSGLLVALVTAHLVTHPPSPHRTWGMRRLEVLAALFQAGLLLAAGVYAFVEGIQRLFSPRSVPSGELVVFGVIGLACNAASILILAGGRGENLSLRASFLEVLNDALGSIGVICAAIVITMTGWQRADTVAGLFIAVLIVPRAILLLRDTVRILMEYTPPGLHLDEVRHRILAVPHVLAVHDLHASTVASGLPTLSAHVVVEDRCFRDGHAPRILTRIRTLLQHDFAVPHATIQLENTAAHSGEPKTHP